MRKAFQRGAVLLIALLMVGALFPINASAAGFIDTSADVSLNIDFRDGTTPIVGATFDIYRVADVDRYSVLTLCGKFAEYSVDYGTDTESWDALAATLKGYVHRDAVSPVATAVTNDSGRVSFSEGLKPGLYLVIGSPCTVDFTTYSAVPFMVFLPAKDPLTKDWTYSASVTAKWIKEVNTDDPDDRLITRKVIKKWDDEGYESNQPESIEVQLLCDHVVYSTVTLDKSVNWRWKWDNLEAGHEWEIVEKDVPEGYYVSNSQDGITITVTNKYIEPIIGVDPPVQKKIIGDTPSEDATFTFVLTAKDGSCPMPAGSTGLTKEMQIVGAQSKEFGEITFTKAGIYTYTISEKNTNVLGYTYDTSVYSLIFTVTEENGELKVDTKLINGKGEAADSAVFTNTYKKPGNKLPQTGQLWWPVPILMVLGVAFVTVGLVRRRRYPE